MPFSGVYYATSNYELHNINYRRPISTTYKPKQVTTTHYVVNAITDEASAAQKSNNHEGYHIGNDVKTIDQAEAESILDGRVNRRVDNNTNSNNTTDAVEELTASTEKDDVNITENFTTTLDYVTTEHNSEFTTITTDSTEYEATTMEPSESNSTTTDYSETTQISASTMRAPITLRTIINSTDCLNSADKRIDVMENRNDYDFPDATTIELGDVNGTKSTNEEGESSSVHASTQNDVTEVDLEFKVNVATASSSLLPKIEPIENVTKTKEESVDYDYNDLPPSLPNLQ